MTDRVCLTFDDELFFGTSGTLENCILRPTAALLEVAHEVGAPLTFFVDATYLLRLRDEPSTAEDLKRYEEHIAGLVSAGHRVELHLHPHWLDAVHDAEGWSFPTYRAFTLQALPGEEAVSLFAHAADRLTEVCRAADSGYQLHAFRAGGLVALPFDAIAAGMRATGISVDSSVAPGMRASSETHVFDYRDAPTSVAWRFAENPLEVDATGEFVEVPVTSYRVLPTDKMQRRSDRRARPEAYEAYGDGGWMPGYATLADRLLPSRSLFTIEATPPAFVLRMLRKHAAETAVFVSHPKALAPVSFEVMRALASAGMSFVAMGDLAGAVGGAQ